MWRATWSSKLRAVAPCHPPWAWFESKFSLCCSLKLHHVWRVSLFTLFTSQWSTSVHTHGSDMCLWGAWCTNLSCLSGGGESSFHGESWCLAQPCGSTQTHFLSVSSHDPQNPQNQPLRLIWRNDEKSRTRPTKSSTHPHTDVDTSGSAARSRLNVSESIIRFNWYMSMHMSEYMSEYVSTCVRQESGRCQCKCRMHVESQRICQIAVQSICRMLYVSAYVKQHVENMWAMLRICFEWCTIPFQKLAHGTADLDGSILPGTPVLQWQWRIVMAERKDEAEEKNGEEEDGNAVALSRLIKMWKWDVHLQGGKFLHDAFMAKGCHLRDKKGQTFPRHCPKTKILCRTTLFSRSISEKTKQATKRFSISQLAGIATLRGLVVKLQCVLSFIPYHLVAQRLPPC